jgi:hypothetical protein
VSMIAKTSYGMNVDTIAIVGTATWLAVLAAPHLYRSLARSVDPAHLTALLDIWVAYADRDDRYMGRPDFMPVPYERRPALARRLRDLLSTWTPPDLPSEITEAARALLHAEGLKWPQGTSWDDASLDLGDRTLESFLVWPEQLSNVLLGPADQTEAGTPGKTP